LRGNGRLPEQSLGLGLPAGASHYRAIVGPPEDYDLVAAMSFNLLTCLGLRQQHRLLDVGCGSLRLGRLFIPYLNAGCYTGIEPNRWLIDEGVRREIGADLVRIKQPRFVIAADASALAAADRFDFAVAQSIFSHAGADLVEQWLAAIAAHLAPSGALAATFLIGDEPAKRGWVYPSCVYYKVDAMEAAARRAGLRFQMLDWKHPRQSWALFARDGFDTSWFAREPLTWNARLRAVEDHASKRKA
jgi:SAM-dependent methyltransferase